MTNDLDAIVFLMFEALPNMKDGEIISRSKFQSHQNAVPHVITVMQTGIIRCDTTCEKDQKEGFCSHCICVALKYNEIQRYIVELSDCQENPFTNFASRNIQKDRVGRK